MEACAGNMAVDCLPSSFSRCTRSGESGCNTKLFKANNQEAHQRTRQRTSQPTPLRPPDLRNGQFLGKGSRKVVHAEERAGKMVAVIRSRSQDLRREAMLMIAIANRSPHPHVMRLIGIEYDALSRLLMVAPIASFGSILDLADHLDFEGLQLTPLHKQHAFIQTLSAVLHLTSIGVDHGDLALRNLLVFRYEPNHPQSIHIRLSDFGDAKCGLTPKSALFELAKHLNNL